MPSVIAVADGSSDGHGDIGDAARTAAASRTRPALGAFGQRAVCTIKHGGAFKWTIKNDMRLRIKPLIGLKPFSK